MQRVKNAEAPLGRSLHGSSIRSIKWTKLPIAVKRSGAVFEKSTWSPEPRIGINENELQLAGPPVDRAWHDKLNCVIPPFKSGAGTVRYRQ